MYRVDGIREGRFSAISIVFVVETRGEEGPVIRVVVSSKAVIDKETDKPNRAQLIRKQIRSMYVRPWC